MVNTIQVAKDMIYKDAVVQFQQFKDYKEKTTVIFLDGFGKRHEYAVLKGYCDYASINHNGGMYFFLQFNGGVYAYRLIQDKFLVLCAFDTPDIAPVLQWHDVSSNRALFVQYIKKTGKDFGWFL